MQLLRKFYARVFLLLSLLLGSVTQVAWAQAPAQRIIRAEELKSSFPDSSLLLLRGLERQESLSDSLRQESHRVLGYTFFYAGKFDSALYHLTASELLSGPWSDPRSMFKVQNALGAVYQRFGNSKAAVGHYLKGLRKAEQMNDTVGRAQIFNNLSILYRLSGDLENSGARAEHAIELYRLLGDSLSLAGTLNNLGLVYNGRYQYDTALTIFQEALDLKRKEGDSERSIANTENNIGVTYYHLKNYDQAFIHYSEANKLRKQAGDRFGMASSSINLANIMAQQGRIQEGWEYVREAEEFGKLLKAFELEKRLFEVRADLYMAENKADQAFAQMRELNLKRDSLADRETFLELARAEFEASASDARADIERMRQRGIKTSEQLFRQRTVNLLFALCIAIFIGMLSLLIYQLAQLRRLRAKLTEERDSANAMAISRRETLNQAAHEIRNPLNGILSIVDLLEKEDDENDRTQMIGLISDSAKRLLGIVDNILSQSRIEEGTIFRAFVKIELGAWMPKQVKTFEPQAQNKGLSLVYEVSESEEPVFVYADADLLHQVLANIIGNAIKFTDEGSVTVHLTREGETATISVIDQGPGISKAQQEFIFKPFFQGNRSKPGTGLGLSIARKYMREMDGDIRFEPSEAAGSNFVITLPVIPSTSLD